MSLLPLPVPVFSQSVSRLGDTAFSIISAVALFLLQTYGSGGMDQQQQNRAQFEQICVMSSLIIHGAVELSKLPYPSIT
jgi:hypothetical protein